MFPKHREISSVLGLVELYCFGLNREQRNSLILRLGLLQQPVKFNFVHVFTKLVLLMIIPPSGLPSTTFFVTCFPIALSVTELASFLIRKSGF